MAKNLSTLERVLADAHLVDLDLSTWDQSIGLYVLADHFRDWSDRSTGRCPLLELRFERVSELHIAFNHLSVDPLDGGAHFQWRIDEAEFSKEDAGRRTVTMSSSQHSAPLLRLAFEAVTISELPIRQIDRAYPGWSRPGAGLVRGGVVEMARRLVLKERRR